MMCMRGQEEWPAILHVGCHTLVWLGKGGSWKETEQICLEATKEVNRQNEKAEIFTLLTFLSPSKP